MSKTGNLKNGNDSSDLRYMCIRYKCSKCKYFYHWKKKHFKTFSILAAITSHNVHQFGKILEFFSILAFLEFSQYEYPFMIKVVHLRSIRFLCC